MILDGFAGPGGWDEGLRILGRTDVVGIEWDADACRTATAAGHARVRADVEHFPLEHLAGEVEGLIMSPPCPDFSTAGKHRGVDGESGRLIFEVMRWARELRPAWIACEQVPPALEWWQRFAVELEADGYRTWAGVLNAADYGVPQTRRRAFLLASLDFQPQPPTATHAREPQPSMFGELAPWVSMADALGWGATLRPSPTIYAGKTGDGRVFGSDQRVARESLGLARDSGAWTVRTGSTLVNRRDFEAWKEQHGDRPNRTIDQCAPTITGEAHRWTVRTDANTMKHSRNPDDVVPYERPVMEPSPTLDAKAGSAWTVNTGRAWKKGGTRADAQQVPASDPAPTIDGKGRWFATRPATTVLGDAHIFQPGAHRTSGSQSKDAIRITERDALILQSFPHDYPLVGTRTSKFRQVGNAVPPRLAAAVLAQFVGQPQEAAA